MFFVFVYDQIELGSPTRIRVYFHHSAGLREHAPLIVGGQAIGRIESIDTVPHGASSPLQGEVGVVALVAIEGGEAWKVPRGAELFVASRGPLSDKYLEVAPPAGRGDPGPSVREGDQLRAADPPSLDNVLQHTWANMTTFRLFMEEVRPELQAFRAQLDQLTTELAALDGSATLGPDTRELIASMRETYDRALGGSAGFDRFAATVKRARATLAQTRATIDLLAPRTAELAANLARVRGHLEAHEPAARVDAAIAQVRATIAKVEPLLATVDEINDRLAKGEGSLGRLMSDPEFPEDAKELGKILKRQPWRVIARPKD